MIKSKPHDKNQNQSHIVRLAGRILSLKIAPAKSEIHDLAAWLDNHAERLTGRLFLLRLTSLTCMKKDKRNWKCTVPLTLY